MQWSMLHSMRTKKSCSGPLALVKSAFVFFFAFFSWKSQPVDSLSVV